MVKQTALGPCHPGAWVAWSKRSPFRDASLTMKTSYKEEAPCAEHGQANSAWTMPPERAIAQ